MTNSEKQALSHALKLRFGTAPAEPNEAQIDQIVEAVSRKKLQKRILKESSDRLSDKEWGEIVKQYCPTAGQYKYAGIDNSDLDALLALAGKGPKT